MTRALYPLPVGALLGASAGSGGVLALGLLLSLLGAGTDSPERSSAADGDDLPVETSSPSTVSPSAIAPASKRAAEIARLDEEARAPVTEVRLAPSAAGVLGAWLLAGPFRAAATQPLTSLPAGLSVDEKKIAASLGTAFGGARDLGTKQRPPAKWIVGSAGPPLLGGGASQDPGSDGSRTIDLKTTLEDATGSELIAYAAGRLHVERAGRHYLMLGVDDGIRIFVDGAVVYTRDDARPVRDDDDIVPLDLTAGDHDIVLKLHQRDGAWRFRAKIVDGSLAPPIGAYLTLPGTSATDAQALAARMSWLVVDRAFDAHSTPPRYRPLVTVRYPEGAPRGVPLPVSVKLSGVPEASAFDVRAGSVAVTSSGVTDLVVALPAIDPWSGTATLEANVAGRVVKSSIFARPQSEQALARMDRALAKIKGDEPWLVPGSLDSVHFLVKRLARFVARGDQDAEAQLEDAKEIDRLAANLEKGVDPYEGRTGMMRRAVVTPLDGAPSELGLYVPPSYKPGDTRKLPLVVGLHGMNSYPISMMRALFGLDEEKKEPYWKDRRPLVPPPTAGGFGNQALVPNVIDAFVITPYAHGNTMYREIGEDDVLHMIQWARSVFPIDDTRISITGPSMGGIGSASIPLHFPHVFSSAEPLCGYHSYMIRPDIGPRPKRPWEKLAIEERSNVYWAENGEHLPLWIIHGTRDLPETNSGVLIERYEKLKYSIKHDHPDAGHNVWGVTYADLKGMKWLLSQRLDPHPSHVRFRTMKPRYGTSAWVRIDELSEPTSATGGWADVDARVKTKSAITLTTTGVSAMTLTRDDKLIEPHATLSVSADGTSLSFDEAEPVILHKNGAGVWEKGPAFHPVHHPVKSGHVAGPLRDAFHEPLLFVYGAGDDSTRGKEPGTDETRANERVARAFANPPGGIPMSYPVMSDEEFLAKKEPLAHDRVLFLVGRTNKVLAALDALATSNGAPFPIHVDSTGVTIGKEKIIGKELGAAFVHPNPAREDRYVVVVEGADTLGTLRALSLPELLPDFMVWDESITPARGQLMLNGASFRAAGTFRNDWSLPASIVDPLAKIRPAAATASPQAEMTSTP